MRDIKDYTEKYVEEPFEAKMTEIRKRTVVEQCYKYEHRNILEIGCGMEPFFMASKDFDNMVVAEPGELFVENAKKLALIRGQGKRIEIVSGCLEDKVDEIKSLGIKFDFIILSSVLHELDDPTGMLSAIGEICSEKSIVHINVPNANSVHRLIAKEAGLIKDVHEQSRQMQKMQRRRTYDMKLLKEEVCEAGFHILDSGSYFVKPFTHMQMRRCLEEGIIEEAVITGLEKLIRYMPEYGAGIYVNVRR